ncbi:MAG: glycolate oxidase subunit GlcE [Dongiaceae bacterium]
MADDIPALLRPADEAQLVELLRWAVAEETPLELAAGGSKRGFGRPVQAAHRLDLSAFAGIRDYQPAELVLTAGPATPLAELEAALAANRQMLAFEPGDWGPLLGGPAGAGTLGGALACALAGPRRIRAGAARDHFLGFRAVSGRGEAFKAGGKVVKNVTGYDLPKLLAGSFGTLAALTEVTVKVLPAPERTRTLLFFGLDDAAALAALGRALSGPFDVSGAAHLPAGIADPLGIPHLRPGAAVTALRLEGHIPSVAARQAALAAELAGLAAGDELHGRNSAAFWKALGDGAPFAGAPFAGDGAEAILWRLSVPPAAGAATVAAIRVPGARWYFDWGGGLIWLALPPAANGPEDGHAAAVRGALAAGGHATLLRGPAALRSAVPVFQPQPAPLAALSRRVKEAFDPRGILNPGRMGF